MPEPLLIGSANRGKARELAELLEGLPWEVRHLGDYDPVEEPEETEATFEANALLKARFYSNRLNVACVADDSGLLVDALDGAPGVYSARYAGPECDPVKNNAKLLQALEAFPWHERTARFVCCAVFLQPGADPFIATGTVEGHIAMDCFGDKGFGYDPVFVPSGFDRTFAEMDPAEKHTLSHRGKAFAQIRAHLESLG